MKYWQRRRSPGPRYRDQPWNAHNMQFTFGAMTYEEKRRVIIAVLRQTGGDVKMAARLVGVTHQTLLTRVRRVGLCDELACIRRESKARFSLMDWPDECEEVA